MAASSSTMAMRRFMQQGYRLRPRRESAVALPDCATILRQRGTFAPAPAPAAGAQCSGDLHENLLDRVSGERTVGTSPRVPQQLVGANCIAGARLPLKRSLSFVREPC